MPGSTAIVDYVSVSQRIKLCVLLRGCYLKYWRGVPCLQKVPLRPASLRTYV